MNFQLIGCEQDCTVLWGGCLDGADSRVGPLDLHLSSFLPQKCSCSHLVPRHQDSLENGHQPGSAGAERQVMAHSYGGQSQVSMDCPHP